MREIKFRAWDDTEKRMYTKTLIGNVTEPDSFDYTAHCIYRDGTWVHIDEHDTDVTFEQFTGLIDKNGVEIYEGDIVMCYPDEIEICHTKVVEWDSSAPSLGITTNGRSGATLCKGNQDILLIIGNIHQNPELLEK